MHSPTLLFSVLIMVALMTGVLFFAWIFNKGIGGLREWFFAFLSALLNISIFLAKASVPPLFSMLVLQTLLISTGALALIGIYRYLEREDIPCKAIGISIVATLSGTVGFILFDPNPVFNFILGSVVAGIYFLCMGAVAWTHRIRRYPARCLFAFIGFLHGAFMCSRAFLFVEGVSDLMFNHLSWNATQLILIEQLVMTTLFGLGIMMLANEKSSSELRVLAEIDSLTNLFNRRAFLKNLEQARSFSRRNKSPLSVLMLDVDHFKRINDTYGHEVGDVVLKSITTTVLAVLRVEDVMGRLGGEEFSIFLPNTPQESALSVAERIRAAVNAAPLTIGEAHILCSVSIGISLFEGDEAMENTLRRADHAMYFAKANGRNRVECALA